MTTTDPLTYRGMSWRVCPACGDLVAAPPIDDDAIPGWHACNIRPFDDAFRVLVTGSRTWEDTKVIEESLDELANEHPRLLLVHGGSYGADAIANRWGLMNGAAIMVHPPQWRTHGRRAGVLRNQHMVDDGADICLAFIRDNSPGATHCANAAERAGIPVRRWSA